jgi:ferrous-iron efflux pump FieF
VNAEFPAASGESTPPSDAVTNANNWKKRAAIASVTVASILITVKIGAWLATGAVSMLSTLIDSFLDLAASAVNLVAVRHAIQPADKEHRFGHGKAEPLAGLAQSAFVAGSAAFLLSEAGERLLRPKPVTNTEVGIAVMVLAIVLTFGLVLFQRWVVRRTGSLVISADSLHYKADLLVNASVIVALVLSVQVGWLFADPVFAVAIAAYLVVGAWNIFRLSLDQLMDRELPREERRRIREIAMVHDKVIDIHDLRTRASGTTTFIQFHLELDANMSLREAHDVAELVMERVEEAFPDAEVLIHEDPYGIDEKRAIFD